MVMRMSRTVLSLYANDMPSLICLEASRPPVCVAWPAILGWLRTHEVSASYSRLCEGGEGEISQCDRFISPEVSGNNWNKF